MCPFGTFDLPVRHLRFARLALSAAVGKIGILEQYDTAQQRICKAGITLFHHPPKEDDDVFIYLFLYLVLIWYRCPDLVQSISRFGTIDFPIWYNRFPVFGKWAAVGKIGILEQYGSKTTGHKHHSFSVAFLSIVSLSIVLQSFISTAYCLNYALRIMNYAFHPDILPAQTPCISHVWHFQSRHHPRRRQRCPSPSPYL